MTLPVSFWRVLACAAGLAALLLLAFLFWVGEIFQPGTPFSRLRDRIEEFRSTTVLDEPREIGGALFPAGTRVRWEDATRRSAAYAFPPAGAEVLGVRAGSFRRLPEAGWMVGLRGAQTIDGWLCTDGSDVELSTAGRLMGCKLLGAQSWRGWFLPEPSHVRLLPDGRGVVLELLPVGAWDTPFESPVVGRMPWNTLFNEDGSPAAGIYGGEAPYTVAGQVLRGEVRWAHDPATEGMGRERPPVSVSGFVEENGTRRHVVVPWPGR